MNKIAKDHVIYAMSSENKPVLNVHSGDRITFETMDCYSDEVTPDEPDRRCHRINPASGPAAVEEAMPGDTLKVTIEKITLGSRALVGSYPNSGTMKELVTRRMIHFLPVQEHQLEFCSDLIVKADPMIGVIGVAPQEKEVGCGTPGEHGGNMDCRKIREGSVDVYKRQGNDSSGSGHGLLSVLPWRIAAAPIIRRVILPSFELSSG